jgi:hypothetical protein
MSLWDLLVDIGKICGQEVVRRDGCFGRVPVQAGHKMPIFQQPARALSSLTMCRFIPALSVAEKAP